MHTVGGQITNPADIAIFFHQLGDVGVHHQLKRRVFGSLADDEFEEPYLRHHQDVRETRFQASQIEGLEFAVGKFDGRPGNLGVGNFVHLVRQSDLVEDFERRGMNGVSAKLAVKVLVHFQKRDRNALPGEKQGQHRAGGTAANDAAGSLLNVANFFIRGAGGGSRRSGHARLTSTRSFLRPCESEDICPTRNLSGNGWSCKNSASRLERRVARTG